MPYKDRETRLAYLKEYKEKNKEKVREQIKQIKHEKYGGTCPVCGERTSGTGPNDPPPMHCEKHKSRTWLVKGSIEQKQPGKKKIVPYTTNRGARFSRLKREKERDARTGNRNDSSEHG